MRLAAIRVDVSPGMFESERAVCFSIGALNYNLFVDQSFVSGDLLHIVVIREYDNSDDVMIELPNATFTVGRCIRVPKSILTERSLPDIPNS